MHLVLHFNFVKFSMRGFIRFLINPSSIVISESRLFAAINSVVILFVLIVIQIILQLVFLIFWEQTSEGIRDYVVSVNARYSIVITCLIAPSIEEFTYRLPLTKFKYLTFKVSISLLLGSFLQLILYLFKDTMINPLLIHGFVALIIFFLIRRLNLEGVQTYWQTNFNAIFWTYQLLFCIIHIPQYLGYGFDIVLLSRSFISTLLCSLFLSFARMKYGLIYSILIHCSYNFIALQLT